MIIRTMTALAMLAASTAMAPAQDAVSLRLNWYMGGLHVPFYYGKERGFYKEEGIDLTINEGRGSANTVQVVGIARRDRHQNAEGSRGQKARGLRWRPARATVPRACRA